MPSLDKLASLSRRMKETAVKVAPGGGQDGSDADSTVTVASSPDSVSVGPVSAGLKMATSNGLHTSEHPVAMNAAGLEAAMLGVRDAVYGVASEVRLLRTDRGGQGESGTPPSSEGDQEQLAALNSRMALLTDEVTALREQLEVQAIQLAEILKILQ